MITSNPELLKVQLKIKRQLQYLESCHYSSKMNYPDNHDAHASWSNMIEATKICLQIAHGEEL